MVSKHPRLQTVVTLLCIFVPALSLTGCGQSEVHSDVGSPPSESVSFVLDGKQASWSHGSELQLSTDTVITLKNEGSTSPDNSYSYKLVGHGTPLRYKLSRKNLSNNKEVEISHSAKARTIVKARWATVNGQLGIAFSADFNADDRYELYWLANSAETLNQALRLTPKLPLASDVADWVQVTDNHFLVLVKRGMKITATVVGVAVDDIQNHVIANTQGIPEFGVLGNSIFWIRDNGLITRYKVEPGTDKVVAEKSLEAEGWLQHFSTGTGVSFRSTNRVITLLGENDYLGDDLVFDGIACGEAAWLISANSKVPVLSQYHQGRKIGSLELSSLPRDFSCDSQR